jgi:hypothetical protein
VLLSPVALIFVVWIFGLCSFALHYYECWSRTPSELFVAFNKVRLRECANLSWLGINLKRKSCIRISRAPRPHNFMVLDPGVSTASDERRLFDFWTCKLRLSVQRFVRLPFYYYWFRKIELRWDWLRRVMFIPSLVKICRVIRKFTLALARITAMTQVVNRLRRETGPINVKIFPLINGKCGSTDANQVCAQLGRIHVNNWKLLFKSARECVTDIRYL